MTEEDGWLKKGLMWVGEGAVDRRSRDLVSEILRNAARGRHAYLFRRTQNNTPKCVKSFRQDKSSVDISKK